MRGPEWDELEAATALGGPELLDIRVTQLESGSEPPLVGVSATGMMLSLLVVAAFAVAFVSAGCELRGSFGRRPHDRRHH